MKKICLMLLAVVMVLSLTLVVQAESTVNIAMTTTMGDLDPFGSATQGRNFLRYAIYDNLAMFKNFGTTWDQMEWVIAKNIEQIDDVTYHVEIYDYVTDALGEPITADDIIFCMESMSNSGKFTRYTNYLDSVTKIDDYNLEIKLKTTTVGALEYLFAQTCIVDQGTYEKYKDQFSTKPITSGAYQVEECVQGSYYILAKNENYWQTDESLRSYAANQQIDKFRYNVITESSQATMSLQNGTDQIITVVGNNELDYFVDADGNAMPGYNINKVLSSTSTVLSFNMDKDNSVFAENLALRQAMLYALNRKAIVAVGLAGNGEIMNDLADKLCNDYDPEWENQPYYDYDMAKAKSLLEEAGYKDGVDPSTGKALHLVLLVDQQYKDAAVVMQAQWAAIGLDIEINALDNSLMATYQYDPTRWDIYTFIQGTECYITSVYDGIFQADSEGKAPKSFVRDDELQRLVEEAHNVSTHSKESVEALHKYVMDNAYAFGLYQSYTFSASVDTIIPVNHPWGQLVGPACDYTEYLAK